MPIINITTELVSLLVTIILLVCSLIDKSRNTAPYKIFTAMLTVNVFLLIDDIIAWTFIGTKDCDIFLWFITSIGYCLGYIISCLLAHYIVACINPNRNSLKFFVRIMDVICFIAILFVIVSAFNRMYFSYSNGMNIRGNMYWLSQAIPIFMLMANEFVVLQNRKELGTRYTLSMMSYAVLPIVAMIVQYSFLDLEITYTASTLSLLIMHVIVNVEQSRRLQKREAELAEARIDIMLSQIQPHFLYNSLTSIIGLCDDNTKAKSALMDFSKYLRANLDSITRKLPTPFETELRHIRIYLSLEKMRFQEKLNVVYNIRTVDFSIPALTVQPLIENAIKYGILNKAGVGTVELTTEENDEYYIVTVSDDGIGFDENEKKDDGKSHIGIENIKHRLLTMCNAHLIIHSTKNVGTTATIKIPKEVIK